MNVDLVSADNQVEQLCREGLPKICGGDWKLNHGRSDSVAGEAVVCIWDLDYCKSLPRDREWDESAVNIVLARQEHILALRTGPTIPIFTILLKPVHREFFLAVLESAVTRQESIKRKKRPSTPRTDRKQRDELFQCLLQTSVKLQECHARQMNFLARALHDLRAPLTAIDGYCGLLLSQRLGPLSANQLDTLQNMQHSTNRLSRMATDMFRLSLGEAREEKPDLRPADIQACISRTLQAMMPLVSAKNLRLSEEISQSTDDLYFDAAQIENVLVNLLENACKFTPRNGSIEVKGYALFWERRNAQFQGGLPDTERRRAQSGSHNAYRVDIRDRGQGIPDALLHTIFEPYASYAGSQDRAGSGLGLAICRMAIFAHRGKIFAQSGEEGATFSFILPVADSAFKEETKEDTSTNSEGT